MSWTILLLLPACQRGNEVTTGLDETLRGGPYSVDRVALNSTVEAAIAANGEPTEVRETPERTRYRIARGSDVKFEVDPSGRVVRVSGRAFYREETMLFRWGDGRDDVEAALGRGRIEEIYRPDVRGMITVGSKHHATEYTYHDDLGTYRIYLLEGRIRGIDAEIHSSTP